MFATVINSINLRPKNPKFFVVGAGLIFLFLVLISFEFFRFSNQIDPFLTSYLQNIIPRSLDKPLSLFSIFGSLEVTTSLLIVLGIVILRKNKVVLPSLGLFGLIMIIELLGKLFLYHPGPPKFFHRYDLPFSTPHYLMTSYSFPSGHVGRTAFLVVVAGVLAFALIKNRIIRICILLSLACFFIVMAVSRIYLGEHWTSDVLGGLLLGSAMGFFAMVYYQPNADK